MKPKEFDELIKQKFDQNDFAYKSGNWDSLAEKLDGRAKKRSAIIWWWVPLAGMAASVAFAMGGSSLLRHGIMIPTNTKTEMTLAKRHAQPAQVNEYKTTRETYVHKEVAYAAGNNSAGMKANRQNEENTGDWFHIKLNGVVLQATHDQSDEFNFLSGDNKVKPKNNKEAVVVIDAQNTFIPEEEEVKKMPKLSLTLLAGYYQSSQGTGYSGGATIRKMVNDKVYIESDVAFTSNSNAQSIQQATYTPGPAASVGNTSRQTLRNNANSSTQTSGRNSTPTANTLTGPNITENETINTSNNNYNFYYAQVSPSIGYKIINRMAIAVGPDFQRMLIDNRPAASNIDRENIQVAPLFDVGFIGKTEYAITKRVKTAVSYRRGVNNLITPDKYIDRDYLQFQLRYTIFNK